MSEDTESQALVCCGGGIDSTALLHYYLARGFTVFGVHFDYGQPACRGERRAVEAVARFYGIPFKGERLRPSINPTPTGEYKGRNTLFILSALSDQGVRNGLISLGVHANAPYYDCTPAFLRQMQDMLDGYYGGAMVVDAPFSEFSKEDIVAYCRDNEVPLHLTYSCERSSVRPCNSCLSCLDRNALL